MAFSRMEIIIWTVNIAWNNRCEQSLMFIEISAICDVNQSFRIAVAVIRIMWRSIMNLTTGANYISVTCHGT